MVGTGTQITINMLIQAKHANSGRFETLAIIQMLTVKRKTIIFSSSLLLYFIKQ